MLAVERKSNVARFALLPLQLKVLTFNSPFYPNSVSRPNYRISWASLAILFYLFYVKDNFSGELAMKPPVCLTNCHVSIHRLCHTSAHVRLTRRAGPRYSVKSERAPLVAEDPYKLRIVSLL